jgi:Family of unknown function (DUF6328)
MPASLANRIKQALDEGRILILGAQVLLGFQFRAAFEPSFDHLPDSHRYLNVAGLALLVVAVGLVLSPAAYHQLVARGEATHDLHRFITAVTGWTLLPFALSLGIDLFVAVAKIAPGSPAMVMGIGGTLVALTFWYGLEWLVRAVRATPQERNPMGEAGPTSLEKKVEEVLTECRVVLPGAQALLGFQLAIVLMEAFDRLPVSSRYVHLASLGAIALTTVLLIAPAAYHRIVERGEDTPSFLRFASATLVASLVTLGLGMAGDLYVVVGKVTESRGIAIAAASLGLFVLYGAWFGFTLARRGRRRHS